MKVEKFTNKILSSNSYILFNDADKDIWIIDPGDSHLLIEWININNKILNGILLTHSHADHIYGLNDLLDKYKKAKVYMSYLAIEALGSVKLNGSLYLEIPFVVDREGINYIEEGNRIPLWQNVSAIVFETPGHNNDCLTFQIINYLFTGDALIPSAKVYTRTKYGDEHQSQKSIEKISNNFDPKTIIHPGHGDICLLEECLPHNIKKKSSLK